MYRLRRGQVLLSTQLQCCQGGEDGPAITLGGCLMATALLPLPSPACWGMALTGFPCPRAWVEPWVSASLVSSCAGGPTKGRVCHVVSAAWAWLTAADWREALQGCRDTKWRFLLRLLSPGNAKTSLFSTMPRKGQRGLYQSGPGKIKTLKRGVPGGREGAGHCCAGQEPRGQPGPAPQGATFTSVPLDVLSWPYLFVMNNYSSPFPSPPAWAQSSPLPKRQRHVKVCCRISIKLYTLRPPAIMHFR